MSFDEEAFREQQDRLMAENVKLRADLDIYKNGGELLGQDRENAIARMREAEANVRELSLQLRDLAMKARAVMNDLETHGPGIVPHLVDTDSNNGQYLRLAVERVLGGTDKQKCPPHYWVGPNREESKCQLCGTKRNDDAFTNYKSGSLCIYCGLGKHHGECDTGK